MPTTTCDYDCGSGLPAIGPVHGEDGEILFVMHCCADCMAHQAYSDWYKSEHGIRPRWMTREECIDAYWQLPGVGVRPS